MPKQSQGASPMFANIVRWTPNANTRSPSTICNHCKKILPVLKTSSPVQFFNFLHFIAGQGKIEHADIISNMLGIFRAWDLQHNRLEITSPRLSGLEFFHAFQQSSTVFVFPTPPKGYQLSTINSCFSFRFLSIREGYTIQ